MEAALAAIQPMKRSAASVRLNAFLLSVQGRALRVAAVAVRSRDDALDVVQEAMLHLARAYGTRPPEEWPPLFYRILENKIRDHQRRQSVRNRVFFWKPAAFAGEDELPTPEDSTPDPRVQDATQRLMQDEAMQHLQAALAALPPRQRQAFTLRIWEGFSTELTASSMRCSEGSVKTHLSRALANLRGKLGDAW